MIEVAALFQHHGILRPGVSHRYREFYYVLVECIHLWDSVQCRSMDGCPHGHVYGVLVVLIHISDIIYL